jgi:hypothetical protein
MLFASAEVVQKEADRWIGGHGPGNNQHPMQLFYQTFAVLPLSSPCSYSATLARTRYRMKQPKKSQNFNNRSGIRSFVWASNPGVHLPVALAVQCCWWRRTSALLQSFPPCSLTPKPPQPTEIATSFLWLVEPTYDQLFKENCTADQCIKYLHTTVQALAFRLFRFLPLN